MMKFSLKYVMPAALACFFFLPGLARAACNDANGNPLSLSLLGGKYIGVGTTNYYTLAVTNSRTSAAVDVTSATSLTYTLASGYDYVSWIDGVWAVEAPENASSDDNLIAKIHQQGWVSSFAQCAVTQTVTTVKVDLDVDSDNNGSIEGSNGTEDSSEDSDEDLGKIIGVNNDDSNEDGTADCLDNAPNGDEDKKDMADLVLKLEPSSNLPSDSIVELSASDWSKIHIFDGDDLINPSDGDEVWSEELSNISLPGNNLELLVEGVSEATGEDSVDIEMTYKVKDSSDSADSSGYRVVSSDKVKLSIIELDLDVDSDNDGSIEDTNGDEDEIEDSSGEPGKIIGVNDDYDYNDGYTTFLSDKEIDGIEDGEKTNGDLAKMTLKLPSGLPSGSKVKMTFSDGTKIRVFNENGGVIFDPEAEATEWVGTLGDDAFPEGLITLYVEGYAPAENIEVECSYLIENEESGELQKISTDKVTLSVVDPVIVGRKYVHVGERSFEYQHSFNSEISAPESATYQWDMETSGMTLSEGEEGSEMKVQVKSPEELPNGYDAEPESISCSFLENEKEMKLLSASHDIYLLDTGDVYYVGKLQERDPNDPNKDQTGSGFIVGTDVTLGIEVLPHSIWTVLNTMALRIFDGYGNELEGVTQSFDPYSGMVTWHSSSFNIDVVEGSTKNPLCFAIFLELDRELVYMRELELSVTLNDGRWVVYSNFDKVPDDVRKQTEASTREPIDTSTGNNYFTERRLYVPCPGVPLELNLDYQSVGAGFEGVLGSGWSHTFEWSLDITSTNIAVYTGAGEKYVFDEQGDGSYAPCESKNWKLLNEPNGYLLKMSGGIEYHFDSIGFLEGINDGWGQGLDLFYDLNDRLEYVEHNNGNRIAFSYIPYGNEWRLQSASVTGGPSLTFSYNAEGLFTQIVEQVDNESYVSTYDYCDGYLTNRVNEIEHEFDYGYEEDQNGTLTGRGTHLSVDDGVYEHSVTYVDSNTVDVVYQARGGEQCFRYEFDDIMRPSFVFGPGATVADACDRGVQYVHLEFDAVEETRFDDDVDEYFSAYKQYDNFHNVTNLSVGYCTTERIPVVSTVYDANGQLPIKVINPEGERIETEYTNGKPVRIKAFYSDTESYDTTFGYDAEGLLQSTTNANNHFINYTYDDNGYLMTTAAELGPVVSNTCSSLGYIERSEILAQDGTSSGRVTLFDNDSKGRVERIDYADGSYETFEYNALDYLTNAVDRAGRATDYVYGPTRKLESVSRYLEQGGTNVAVTVAYDLDEQLNILSITEPRNRYVESYKLDIQDRVTSVTNIEDQVMSIEYGLGDFVRKTTRFDNSYITNTYDTAGRVASVEYYDADDLLIETIDYDYYVDGQAKSIADSASSITNVYDSLNRITNQTVVVSNMCAEASSEYDPVGNLTNSTVSADGVGLIETGYEYDNAERLETISTTEAGNFEYVYDSTNGRIASVSNTLSGITASYEYDIMDQVTNITYSQTDGSLITSLEYDYNIAGMITNKTIVRASGNIAYGYKYDSLNRLIAETWGSWCGYEYDLAGNVTNMIVYTGSCEPYCHDDDGDSSCDTCSAYCMNLEYTYGTGNRQLTWWGNSELSAQYDDAGNTTNLHLYSVEMDLQWDERYRLTSAVQDSVFEINYTYDVLGRRTSCSVSNATQTSTTHYIYEGNQVVADLDESGNLLRSYTYGPGIDNILSMTVYGTSATNTYYYLKDHQNSVIALADANASIVEYYDYNAWGYVGVKNGSGNSINESAYGNRYLFQGREYDWNTKLYYFRARWYNPEAGRWLSKDPIGIAGGLNLYAFCGNNPVNFVDPLGLCSETKTTTISLYGVRMAAVLGILFDVSIARDSNGDNAIIITSGGGVGVDVKVPVPGTNVSVNDGDVYSQGGFDSESHVGVVGGISTDNEANITGGEAGNVGGGHYWVGKIVIPLH